MEDQSMIFPNARKTIHPSSGSLEGGMVQRKPKEEILPGGYPLVELQTMVDFLKGCFKGRKYCCSEHPESKITSDGIANGTPRAICTFGKDDRGKALRHSFNPLAKWYFLRDIAVPETYHKVWQWYTEKYPPPPDCEITVTPCPKRYLERKGKKRFFDPNSPDPKLPLSPNKITHVQEGIEACKRGRVGVASPSGNATAMMIDSPDDIISISSGDSETNFSFVKSPSRKSAGIGPLDTLDTFIKSENSFERLSVSEEEFYDQIEHGNDWKTWDEDRYEGDEYDDDPELIITAVRQIDPLTLSPADKAVVTSKIKRVHDQVMKESEELTRKLNEKMNHEAELSKLAGRINTPVRPAIQNKTKGEAPKATMAPQISVSYAAAILKNKGQGIEEFPLPGKSKKAPKPQQSEVVAKRKFFGKASKKVLTSEEAHWVLSGRNLSQFGRERNKLRMMYFLNMARNHREHIRAALRTLKIDTRKILDIGFMGSNITSLLVPENYCSEVIEKMKAYPKATFLEDFDLLDTSHMSKMVKYKNMTMDELRQEALKMAQSRLRRQAEKLPKSRTGTYNFIMMQANSLSLEGNRRTAVAMDVDVNKDELTTTETTESIERPPTPDSDGGRKAGH
jgi:hypothetical protein